MTEKDYYDQLLQKMVNAANEMSNTISKIDTMKNKLGQALSINGRTFKDDELTRLRNDAINQRDTLNNVIIPAITNKMNSLDTQPDVVVVS